MDSGTCASPHTPCLYFLTIPQILTSFIFSFIFLITSTSILRSEEQKEHLVILQKQFFQDSSE